jgi:meiotically up-regulated gene 157 (Mug157) protein
MKTAEEILRTTDHEVNSIEQVVYEHDDVIQAMKEYAKEACKVQRNICSYEANMKPTVVKMEGKNMPILVIDRGSITGAKEPNLP